VAVQGHELLRAVEHRLHRPPRLARERGDQCFEPEERLRPERAAHRRSDHADVLLGHAERERHVGAQVERRLRPRDEDEPAVLPRGQRGVRLHRRVRRARRAELSLHDHVGVHEAGGDVAVADPEAMAHVRAGQRAHADRDRLAGRLRGGGVQQRRPGRDRRHRVEHRGQLRVVDLDRPGRGERHRARGCRDGRDDVAHVAGDVGEHELVARLAAVRPQVRDVLRKERHAAGGHGGGVDAIDARVGVRRAHERRMPHPGQLRVQRVALGSRQPRIDADRAHSSSSSARRTSTATIRRRYAAEPRASEIGSIRSA
jgi:hypothetical protein